MFTQKKYHTNLYVDSDRKYIYSYRTQVATIDHEKKSVLVSKFWSRSTTKHINYVALQLDYKVNKLY